MTIRLLLPLTISLLLSGLASAAPVQLVTGDDYAPFTDRELPQGGMLTELVQQALLQAGHQPKLSWLPWKRGYQATLRGQFDATFPYLKTAEREADYLFSAPPSTRSPNDCSAASTMPWNPTNWNSWPAGASACH